MFCTSVLLIEVSFNCRYPNIYGINVNVQIHLAVEIYTLLWKYHLCYTLPPVFSSSGHHSDGVTCVVLEATESGLSCSWVIELQGGLITTIRLVGHSGGVEAAGIWTSPLPCYPDTWGIHELSSDISGSGRSWGGTVLTTVKLVIICLENVMHIYTWQRNHSRNTWITSSTLNIVNQDGILCVALQVGQGGTGWCCIIHCVHHRRASLRSVANPNKVKHTLTWPLPWHSDTCVICSDFSSHSE